MFKCLGPLSELTYSTKTNCVSHIYWYLYMSPNYRPGINLAYDVSIGELAAVHETRCS